MNDLSLHNTNNDLDLKRFGCKIFGGECNGGGKVVYYNTGFTFQQYFKWRWYFKYREALYKVQNPKHYTEFHQFDYEYVPSKVENQIRLNNKIKGKKAAITKLENAMENEKKHWDKLFPLEDEPMWKKATEKLNKLKFELQTLTIELAQL